LLELRRACPGLLVPVLKLPASNLLDTAAANLLLSLDFLLALLSVVWQWTVGWHCVFVPCSCAAVDDVTYLNYLF